MSDNAYINYLEEQNAELRRELAEAKEHIERMTKPWRFQLITLPVPRKQEPGDYPDLSESYELSLVDTGHSERVYLLGSNELDKRINDLQSQLTAANATIAELESQLAKLPTTLDGRRIVPGMNLYSPNGTLCAVLAVWFDGTLDMQSHDSDGLPLNNWKLLRASKFAYSTPAASREAQSTTTKGLT